MSTLADALDHAAWGLGPSERASVDDLVAGLPQDLRGALAGAVLDPERSAWARAALAALRLVVDRGATPKALATEEILECTDPRGEPFGVLPLAFRHAPNPAGRPEDLERLLAALDAAFARRRYALWVRRPLPERLDVDPIRRAVVVWLTNLHQGDRQQTHAVYEEDGIALDLTVLDAPVAPGTRKEGRVATVLPLVSLERLVSLDDRLTDAAGRAEESVGRLPLVVVAASDQRWSLARGYLQTALYGTPTRVSTVHGPAGEAGGSAYEAEFVGLGRSVFSDPACRSVARLALLDRTSLAPERAVTYENPWASTAPTLRPLGPTFAARTTVGARVVLRWERG